MTSSSTRELGMRCFALVETCIRIPGEAVVSRCRKRRKLHFRSPQPAHEGGWQLRAGDVFPHVDGSCALARRPEAEACRPTTLAYGQIAADASGEIFHPITLRRSFPSMKSRDALPTTPPFDRPDDNSGLSTKPTQVRWI